LFHYYFCTDAATIFVGHRHGESGQLACADGRTQKNSELGVYTGWSRVIRWATAPSNRIGITGIIVEAYVKKISRQRTSSLSGEKVHHQGE